MTLPFKPHVLALLCSAGLLAAAGTLYVKSREPQTAAEPPAVTQTAQATAAAQPVTTALTPAQIDQWVAPGEAASPLGPAFSPVEPGEGYHGYRFRIIKDGGNHGVALLAWPATWGKTGIMSFMVNQDDRVYQTNLGEETPNKAQAISQFSPDNGWQAIDQ